MASEQKMLPEFESPPVAEVLLGVQFQEIKVSLPWLGRWALELEQHGYVDVEQHPPLDPMVEKFGQPRAAQGIQFAFGPPHVRTWFVSRDKTKLIQFQPDRFIHNWRKVNQGDSYPRYENIKGEFTCRWRNFCSYFDGKKVISPNLVEVAYVNSVPASYAESLAALLTLVEGKFSDGFLPVIEASRFSSSFVIPFNKKPVGRLHVEAHTAFDVNLNEPVYILKLTARVKPLDSGEESVMAALDLGHEWVVRGFADITEKQMHVIWKRRS